METHKPKTASINDFREWDARGELVLAPRFQRRKVWSPKAKSFLIDTILRGFPIPAVYIRQKIDLTTKKTVREVVDGQQRIRAILEYINDKFTILKVHNKVYGGLYFSELPEDIKNSFLEFDLSIDLLVGATDGEVLDVFARINSYTVVLNRQEKLNAEFNGQFKQLVFELGRIHLEFWRRNKILTDYGIMRMGEAELCTDLVIAIIDGIQDKKKIKSFYKKYDDNFPHEETIKNRFERCIDIVAEIFGNAFKESEFSNKTLFHSLFCAIYDLVYGLPNSETPKVQIKKELYGQIRNALQKLENEVSSKMISPEYSEFKDASSSRTTDRLSRLKRHQTIVNEILLELDKR